MKDKTAKKQVKEASALDEQTFGYFKRVEDVINEDDFEDEESRRLFVSNVFLQLENNEVKLFCDQIISRTMEKLVVYLDDVQIRKVMQNIEEHFSKIAVDKFGSHVMQTLISVVPTAIRSERRKSKQEMIKDLKSVEELFLSLCDRLKENLAELVDHVYGSHVVRTAFEVLGGVKVADNVVRSRASRISRERSHQSEERKHFIKLNQVGNAFGSSVIKPMETVAVPESFPPVLKKLTKIISKMELVKLVLHPVSNPLVQTLLLVLHKKDLHLCMKLCKAIMSQIDMLSKKKDGARRKSESKGDDDDDDKKERSYRVPVLFSNEISSHLVEKILHVVSPEIWQELYESYFRTHLAQLSQHPIANYIVQHLMASTGDKSQAKLIIVELLPYLEDVLALGHMGVVVRITEISIRFSIKQKKIFKAILRAFHCEGKDQQINSVALISSLTTHEVFFGTKEEDDEEEKKDGGDESAVEEKQPEPKLQSLNFHGTLLLKTLFEFEDPSILVESLLSLSLEELMMFTSDQMGSYAAEAFLKSRSVPTEKKHKLIEKLEGTFSKLACEKQGSHVVETCWRQAEVKYKEAINKELAHNEQQLNSNFYGRIVLRNCGVEHFKRKDKSWHEREQNAAKKRKMLEEILEERKESVHPKKVRAVEENKFAKLAPEMAALGFTAVGNAAEYDVDEEMDLRSLNKDDNTDTLRKTKKKRKSSTKEKNKTEKRETKETRENDGLEFILTKSEKKKKKVK